MITAWLQHLYHPSPIPALEHNATTLGALQRLMVENAAADRLRDLIFGARVEELTALEAFGSDRAVDADELLKLLEQKLSDEGNAPLNSLAESSVTLECSATAATPILEALESKILDLPQKSWALEDQLTSITALTTTIANQIRQTEQQITDLRLEMSSLVNPSPHDQDNNHRTTLHQRPQQDLPDFGHLHAQTQQHNLETKQLSLKATEYRSRINNLSRQLAALNPIGTQSGLTLLAERQHALEQTRKAAEESERRIKGFHGLPPDIEASRAEVRRAQRELDALKGRRDELFQRL
jgi:HAUS augmin-like complex subunit 1